jgi:hypothetical protein
MQKLEFALSLLGLFAISWLVLSCGAISQDQPGQLQSVTLSPASADGKDYPNGQVTFTATGVYSNPTRTVTPLSANWGTCYQDGITNAVTVSRGGVAQCVNGAVGTYTVWADAPPNPNAGCAAMTACGGGCFVAGTAQLTCP